MSRIPPEFQVAIPPDRIAQFPPLERGQSRFLVVSRPMGKVIHIGRFDDITKFISDDLLVLNETKVLPARISGRRPGGGRAELLFLIGTKVGGVGGEERITALISPPHRTQEGLTIQLPGRAWLRLLGRSGEGGWVGIWSGEGESFDDWLEMWGSAPLPPYIRRGIEPADRERYQTVYAHESGSVAAPTAGLHFTNDLLAKLEYNGAEIARVTLSVGLGTFEPIREEELSRHCIHTEDYHISSAAATAINAAKQEGRPVTAVGTTTVRALEDAAGRSQFIQPGSAAASLFIYPPYQFKIVERLITNFHRTDSTLLQLVAGMIGWELVNEAYQTALDEGFMFYSYGDAMLIV